MFTGAYAINPASGLPVPVWIADYVKADYGSGAKMAVPANNERDYEFAKKFGLSIIEVVAGDNIEEAAHVAEGVAINSQFLDGLNTIEAKAKMIAWLEEESLEKGETTYKLLDWLFSRQRYWGEPFPITHDPETGAIHTVPTAGLPITMPVHIKGKRRAELTLGRTLDKTQIEEIARQAKGVEDKLAGPSIKKIIFVPGKLVDFIV